ncbi:MAG TPA: cysteine hydrolase family protein [Candidatus Acidoferrum sp.]|jgi:nicotinamidase-related amidase|nr:cysteine hydrolase family protein [Candidatus Acidoferrum sp.]
MGTVLLVIDIQRSLVADLAPDRRSGFLRTVGELLERARTAGTPLVYVRHNDDELPLGTAGWEIAEEVAPRPGEPIVEKRFRDAFRETGLEPMLKELGADHLVVCGMQTEFCVDATIREAERRGYRVTLVEDGHATYPAGSASEEQIRAQVHRVARGSVAAIVPAAEIFTTTDARA